MLRTRGISFCWILIFFISFIYLLACPYTLTLMAWYTWDKLWKFFSLSTVRTSWINSGHHGHQLVHLCVEPSRQPNMELLILKSPLFFFFFFFVAEWETTHQWYVLRPQRWEKALGSSRRPHRNIIGERAPLIIFLRRGFVYLRLVANYLL